MYFSSLHGHDDVARPRPAARRPSARRGRTSPSSPRHVERALAHAGHDPHRDRDVGRVGQLDADLGDRRAERAHRERHDVHRAALHRRPEQAVEHLAHLGRVVPVVRRAGVLLALGADERAVLDARDVARIRQREVGVRALGVARAARTCRRRRAPGQRGRTPRPSRRTSGSRRAGSARPPPPPSRAASCWWSGRSSSRSSRRASTSLGLRVQARHFVIPERTRRVRQRPHSEAAMAGGVPPRGTLASCLPTSRCGAAPRRASTTARPRGPARAPRAAPTLALDRACYSARHAAIGAVRHAATRRAARSRPRSAWRAPCQRRSPASARAGRRRSAARSRAAGASTATRSTRPSTRRRQRRACRPASRRAPRRRRRSSRSALIAVGDDGRRAGADGSGVADRPSRTVSTRATRRSRFVGTASTSAVTSPRTSAGGRLRQRRPESRALTGPCGRPRRPRLRQFAVQGQRGATALRRHVRRHARRGRATTAGDRSTPRVKPTARGLRSARLRRYSTSPSAGVAPASRRGTSTRRLNSATRMPSWLSTRVWTLTVPRSGLERDSACLEHLGLARTACRRGRPAPGA